MLESLDLLSVPGDLLTGAPMQLPIDSIDEDPDQPRHEFDGNALAELAATIRERGVRQPVSVRRHPEDAERWLLNFGARRLRASRLAGMCLIPAFVDDSPDTYDQVIENEQRENLSALDLALFIGRRMGLGESQAEIARQMGKSPTFVTMACVMIDPPDALMGAYRSGRCRGVTELYRLRNLLEKQPQLATTLLESEAPISRAAIAAVAKRPVPLEGGLSPGGEPASGSVRAEAPLEPPVAVRGTFPVQLELALEAERLCDRLATILEQLDDVEAEEVAACAASLRAKLSRLAAVTVR